MLENKSNPKEEEASEEEESTLEEEELENASEELDELFEEEEPSTKEEPNLLEQINKGAKKKFKDVTQVVDALKQTDKKFIKKGTKKETKREAPIGLEERLIKLENPDSEFVLEEMREDAKSSGKGVPELWDTVPYYQKKAQSLAEESRSKEEAEDRIGEPTGRPSGKGITLSQKDKKLMTDLGVTAKEVAETKERRSKH